MRFCSSSLEADQHKRGVPGLAWRAGSGARLGSKRQLRHWCRGVYNASGLLTDGDRNKQCGQLLHIVNKDGGQGEV